MKLMKITNILIILVLMVPVGSQASSKEIRSIFPETVNSSYSISGKVTDAQGNPLAGITVQASQGKKQVVVLVHGWQGGNKTYFDDPENWKYKCSTGITQYDPSNPKRLFKTHGSSGQ